MIVTIDRRSVVHCGGTFAAARVVVGVMAVVMEAAMVEETKVGYLVLFVLRSLFTPKLLLSESPCYFHSVGATVELST